MKTIKINFYLKRIDPTINEATTFIKPHKTPKQFLLHFIVFELLFPMVLISKLYHLSHRPISCIENGHQNTKMVFLSISDDYNVTSIHDKANLITYLCTQCGLLLQVVHNFCVNQPIL